MEKQYFENAVEYRIWVIMKYFYDGPFYVYRESGEIEAEHLNEALQHKAWWLNFNENK